MIWPRRWRRPRRRFKAPGHSFMSRPLVELSLVETGLHVGLVPKACRFRSAGPRQWFLRCHIQAGPAPACFYLRCRDPRESFPAAWRGAADGCTRPCDPPRLHVLAAGSDLSALQPDDAYRQDPGVPGRRGNPTLLLAITQTHERGGQGSNPSPPICQAESASCFQEVCRAIQHRLSQYQRCLLRALDRAQARVMDPSTAPPAADCATHRRSPTPSASRQGAVDRPEPALAAEARCD